MLNRGGAERVRNGGELKIVQEALETRFGAREAGVVPELGEQWRGDSRLRRIELPRVQVEHSRLTLSLAVLEGRMDEGVREDAKVGATGGGDRHAEAAQRRWRELGDRPRRTLDAMRPTPRRRISIAVGSPDRKKAGVIGIAFFDQ